MLADVENAEAFMQKLGLLYLIKKQKGLEANELALSLEKKEKNKKQVILKREDQINRLLDIYNDYRFLFEWFRDDEYLQVMKAAIRELKKLSMNGL